MSVIAALLLLSLKGEPDVVYCARTYKQGKAKSHYSMFLCRHDGTGKKQISRPNEVVTAATWIDDHTIGYLRLKESYGEFDDVDKYHGTICSLDLKTDRRRDLKQVLLNRPAERTFQRRGVLNLDFNDYSVSRTAIVTVKPVPEYSISPRKELPPNHEFSSYAEHKTGSGAVRIEWQENFSEDPQSKFKLKISGPKSRIINQMLLGSDVDNLLVNGNQIFLLARKFDSMHDRTVFIHQIDLESGKSKLIIPGVGDNTFSPDKALWLANERNDYNLELLDDGRAVHVDRLYSGNWKTGQRWTITGKLTDVVSASLK